MSRMLREVVEQAGPGRIDIVGDDTVTVDAIEFDSRRIGPGALFCCLRGTHSDGHAFAGAARSAGAAAVLVDHRLDVDLPQLVVPDTREAMGWLAASFFGHPSRSLTLVGVTGTNGKTTTTSFIVCILTASGRPTGSIGTLTGAHTTPESPDLQARLAEFVAGGVTAVVMEVSSHALELQRVVGCHFDIAVFTNLGRDHLDLHGTEERYFAAKAKLFQPELSDCAVVNIDDPHGRLLMDVGAIPTEGYGLADVSDIAVSATSHSYTWRGQHIDVPIGGEFNVMNSLAAATACARLGLDSATIAAGLHDAPVVPGRFEAVVAGQAFAVIVDYAHTPDGLEKAIGAARQVAGTGSVHVVFGCGGDRDRDKRPLMGATASRLADHVVITSDNPRSEDPLAIINATVEGVSPDYRGRVVIEPDRRQAIEIALREARSGDVVLIAGKGHEQTQTIGEHVIEFDDRAVAREVLRGLQ
ncbi:MAG TPA: UDP-N-acetylmuramoyl-L-alanyl-D-glutamate--2,6-diaminopimelate ligase [Ilumatobacteraceae bacterium]|nr:UDP-N-acetylmuramoyl-L-alanyl-D-glutamate--2,6-diaminopimelate ligase [Ilumatobacteraceae bacterium]